MFGELTKSVLRRGPPVDNSRCPAFYFSSRGSRDDMWVMRIQCLNRAWFPMASRRVRSESPHVPLWERASSASPSTRPSQMRRRMLSSALQSANDPSIGLAALFDVYLRVHAFAVKKVGPCSSFIIINIINLNTTHTTHTHTQHTHTTHNTSHTHRQYTHNTHITQHTYNTSHTTHTTQNTHTSHTQQKHTAHTHP